MKNTQSLLLISTLVAPMILGTSGVAAKSAEVNPPKETLVRIHVVTDMNAMPVDRRNQPITRAMVAFRTGIRLLKTTQAGSQRLGRHMKPLPYRLERWRMKAKI